MAVGTWGTITFDVASTLKESFSSEYQYVQIPKLQGYPTLQKVGDALMSIDLVLRFSDRYNRQPLTELSNLKFAADSQIVAILTIGLINWGNYVISKIGWVYTDCDSDGMPFMIDVDVTFLQASA